MTRIGTAMIHYQGTEDTPGKATDSCTIAYGGSVYDLEQRNWLSSGALAKVADGWFHADMLRYLASMAQAIE